MPRGEHNRKLSSETWQQIINDYLTPLPDGTWSGCDSLAQNYGVSQSAVYYHLRHAGVRPRTYKESHACGKRCKPITNLPPKGTRPPLCKCGCGQSVQWNHRRNKWNIYAKGHYRPKRPYHDPAWLAREYLERHRTLSSIAQEFGVSPNAIAKAIDKADIPRRPQGESLRFSGAVKGAHNPAWKGGVSPERQRLHKEGHWHEFVQMIYARDDFRCQRCGSPKQAPKDLQAHHIRPWADYPELRFEPDNIVTLCRKCHVWVHSNANVNKELLV